MYHRNILHSPSQEDRREMPANQPANNGYRVRSPLQPAYDYSPGRPQHSPPIPNLPPISSNVYHQRDYQPAPAPPPQKSSYYDPTQDAGDRSVGRSAGRFDGYSTESRERRESISYSDHRPMSQSSNILRSPINTSLPHPSPLPSFQPPPARHPSQSPHSPRVSSYRDNYYQPPPPVAHERKPSREMPTRTADPMSLSSIMSGNQDDVAPTYPSKPVSDSRRSSRASTSLASMKVESIAPPSPLAPPPINPPIKSAPLTSPVQNGQHDRDSHPIDKKHQDPTGKVNERDVLAALAKIEAMDETDVDLPNIEYWENEYRDRNRKRMRQLDTQEETKRKRRRQYSTQRMVNAFEADVRRSRQNYFQKYEPAAWQEVQDSEIAEEKERKKDMQRERRRQKTLATETQKAKEAFDKAKQANDDGEKLHWKKEAMKHEKKSRQTEILLQGGTPMKDLRDSTPGGPNLEGGVMSTLNMSEGTPREGKRGRGNRWANRPRKTKEQKAMEKELAAAGQAALDRGEELPAIAPKEAKRLEAAEVKEKEVKPVVESIHRGTLTGKDDYEAYTSKAYNQIYESIWRDIGKNGVNKVYRIKNDSLTTRQSNLRKTAQLASKEARRWQLRTNKSTKDVQARAKRSMKEMLSFWKRNERDERDQRKVAERQELENAKKAEADREAERQRRKLNFLISQTELYSHFIGKKVKTDDIERSTDDAEVAATDQKIDPGQPHQHTIDLPDSNAKLGAKVTNFEDLDFDGDEKALQEAAMANAQHAVMEAKRRAQQFDEGAKSAMDDMDDGEMNFQNPTSLGNMDIPQPKLLSCQLKEYQLKGLNWLTNLYEQGINGILADEMGLGKTVQSISVMAYLAETHNIWGPFLVIAPASTLHNWQQEIAKFVPEFKVLPYWGTAKDRKTLRKFWDRKHITYRKDAPFHVMVTSYQMVVVDAPYFQKMRWQYMILDEAQAIKSSSSSRWKALLNYHCRNRLLLTGTPIQNNMQELWALLHFIMPSLFDSHDEFSEWFSKDIENHAQSNTKLNEDQLKRLHMILKPFMLRRIKKHVQKELGDKVELDVYCDLTYRQRAYYTNLRNKISIMDLIEKAAVGGDDQDTATLMNLVMQFRKVCNHPDLFERADTHSPVSFSTWAETASFLREGNSVQVAYSVRNLIEFQLPRLAYHGGRLDLAGPSNPRIGWRNKWLHEELNIWKPENIHKSSRNSGAFSWMRFADVSAQEISEARRRDVFTRATDLKRSQRDLSRYSVMYDGEDDNRYIPAHALFSIRDRTSRHSIAKATTDGYLYKLMNVAETYQSDRGLHTMEACAEPKATAPPIDFYCSSQAARLEAQRTFFNVPMRAALFPVNEANEEALIRSKVDLDKYPVHSMLPAPEKHKDRYTHISVPSMRRFVSDCGKLAKLDQLLRELKENGHRVLLYFQMTRMIDLMEEYLTYRNYKYCRLDGSTKLEDRRDTVADFQTQPEIFVFLLSTRAGGLGINLTSADTVIFYDSDWNPTIDSQAMDRAHRLGQTKQVTVYRLITRGTIEERIRKRAQQKEEVQRVVITGHTGNASGQIDFNARSRDNRTKDIALWLADDDQAAAIEQKEKELEEAERLNPSTGKKSKKAAGGRKGKDISMDDMYHEGEGHFDDKDKASGAATPMDSEAPVVAAAKGKAKRGKGMSKKAKTLKQRLAVADGSADPETFQ